MAVVLEILNRKGTQRQVELHRQQNSFIILFQNGALSLALASTMGQRDFDQLDILYDFLLAHYIDNIDPLNRK